MCAGSLFPSRSPGTEGGIAFITLIRFQSNAALATVVDRLVEVPMMLFCGEAKLSFSTSLRMFQYRTGNSRGYWEGLNANQIARDIFRMVKIPAA